MNMEQVSCRKTNTICIESNNNGINLKIKPPETQCSPNSNPVDRFCPGNYTSPASTTNFEVAQNFRSADSRSLENQLEKSNKNNAINILTSTDFQRTKIRGRGNVVLGNFVAVGTKSEITALNNLRLLSTKYPILAKSLEKLREKGINLYIAYTPNILKTKGAAAGNVQIDSRNALLLLSGRILEGDKPNSNALALLNELTELAFLHTRIESGTRQWELLSLALDRTFMNMSLSRTSEYSSKQEIKDFVTQEIRSLIKQGGYSNAQGKSYDKQEINTIVNEFYEKAVFLFGESAPSKNFLYQALRFIENNQ